MANKSVYQDFDTDAVQHFGLEAAPSYGVASNTEVNTVLLTEDQTTYEKIGKIITTDTVDSTTFKACKKAFLLPRSPVSIDRVRAACKEHNIVLTNDYELADLLLTHDDIKERCEHGETIKSTLMLAKLWNYESFDDGNSAYSSSNVTHEYSKTTGNPVIYHDKIRDTVNRNNLSVLESIYDQWLITGLAVNLAYKIDMGTLSVIDVDTVVCESANKQELTEDVLKDLINQMKTTGDDLAIAGMMLPTIDYTKNYHLLWELAKQTEYKMYHFNRNKDIQYWVDKSNYDLFTRKSAQDMILWLEQEEKLDAVSFRYLEPLVRKEISIHNRDLYVFKVEVKPEYRKYLKIKLNEEDTKTKN